MVMDAFAIEVFFDGACPLCAREVRILHALDRRGRIRWVDIARPGFDASALGVSFDDLMARMHGRLPDGTWVEGVETFRRIYAALGFEPLVALTRLPGIAHALDWAYERFARNRLRLTGRCAKRACTARP
jgi:predicted DCC family thiol-disulfide oxidoreductase YuxK